MAVTHDLLLTLTNRCLSFSKTRCRSQTVGLSFQPVGHYPGAVRSLEPLGMHFGFCLWWLPWMHLSCKPGRKFLNHMVWWWWFVLGFSILAGTWSRRRSSVQEAGLFQPQKRAPLIWGVTESPNWALTCKWQTAEWQCQIAKGWTQTRNCQWKFVFCGQVQLKSFGGSSRRWCRQQVHIGSRCEFLWSTHS